MRYSLFALLNSINKFFSKLCHCLIGFLFFSMCLIQGFLNAQTFDDISGQFGSINSISTDTWGTGVSFYDFNQDGWDDISFATENGSQKVFINNHGQFSLAPFSIVNQGETKHLLWVDYDNDADLDLYVTTKNGQNFLWENDGQLGFTDVTISSGLSTNPGPNYGASFGDYDLDGDLDLYQCRYLIAGDSSLIENLNRLYRNEGDGTFTDVTSISGLENGIAPSFQSVWFDFNNDEWPDLFVINDRFSSKNYLYQNNGNGSFTELADSAGIAYQMSNPMTASFSDFDNDDDLDVFISNTSHVSTDMPYLFVNSGNGNFVDQGSQFNLKLRQTSWGAVWIDYDNDGWQDLYVATDYLNQNLNPYKNYFYKNINQSPFAEDSAIFIGSHNASSHSVARGDVNNDGFYDIVVTNDEQYKNFLWQNSGNSNNYIKVSLEGTISNYFAIGSWIRVFAGGNQFNRYVHCGEGYLGQNSQYTIFGLGSQISFVDSIQVTFPSGSRKVLKGVAVNQNYHIVEDYSLDSFEIVRPDSTNSCLSDSMVLSSPEFDSYLWNTGDTTREIVVNQPGFYSVRGFNSPNLYQYSTNEFIDFTSLPVIESAVILNTCYQSNDAQIRLNILNDGQAYAINWNTGVVSDSLISIASGSYSYIYQDALGCLLQDSIFVPETQLLNVQSQWSLDTSTMLAEIDLLINGGSSPYQVLYDGESISEEIDSFPIGSYIFSIEDDNGCQINHELDIYFNGSTGLISSQNLELELFVIKPNPASDNITILPKIEIIRIFLNSLEGKQILTTLSNKIDVSSLDCGIYFLNIQSRLGLIRKTLIINK